MIQRFAVIGGFLIFLCTISDVNSYTKYGRGCNDIGCLPTEVCVMAQDSCNYGQRDGKECGTYPTCRRNANTAQKTPGASLNPAPGNTRFSQSSNPSQHSNQPNLYNPNPTPINPNYVFGAPQIPPVYTNGLIFPHQQPTSPPQFQQFPQANHPQYPQYPAHNILPQNPFNPPYVFGNQPTYPQATTKQPSLLHQFFHNKDDPRRNSSQRTYSNLIFTIIGLIFIKISNSLSNNFT